MYDIEHLVKQLFIIVILIIYVNVGKCESFFYKFITKFGIKETIIITNKDDGKIKQNEEIIPKSVNYHFTRRCNYECGFCFHTAKTSYMLNLEDAQKGLRLLKFAGMKKINFSGGEPFLPQRGKHLGEMVKYCKKELNLSSVTVVSNGSLITEKWFQTYGEYVDIMAISCDSFDESTNKAIGRGQGRKHHIEQLFRVGDWCEKYNVLFKINTVVNTHNQDEDMAEEINNLNPAIGRGQGRKHHIEQLFRVGDWCEKYNVLFKINTVVNTHNQDEDMAEEINNLNPVRWKVFQCLLLEGENAGPDALRNAEKFYISEEIFDKFLDRHKEVKCLVPESNKKMQNSYLILDEYMRFLDCRNGGKIPSKSILDIGVSNALKFSGFDEQMFKKRGGIYKWSKDADMLSW